MPTPLPRGRRFWRRYAPSEETKANLVSTSAEFVMALVFVVGTLLLIAFATRAAHAKPLAVSVFTPAVSPSGNDMAL